MIYWRNRGKWIVFFSSVLRTITVTPPPSGTPVNVMNPDRSKIPAALGEFGEQLAISEILNSQQIEELNEKLESGRWPTGARELASRLFYEKWLTEFQARKLIANRASELIVGRYLIVDRIGGGAMGDVFKAEHQYMGRVVALKMIKQEMMSDRLIKRFRREMRLAARMNHPNVVRAYDADQVGNLFYIAMEYVPGKSLGELLKAGPLRMQDVVRYGAQAALGLDHAHQQGILHRDVKPSNILLSSEDRKTVKVLDLGLGMLIDPSSGDPMLTQAGNVVGTYDYMSPEQVKGRTLDGRSDLYSLGCTMYHLMTGYPPFRHEIPMKRMSMRIDTRPTPISEYLPDMPRRLIAIMDKMLAVDPEDRFQSGLEVNDALMGLFKTKGRMPGESTSSQDYPKPAQEVAPEASAESATDPEPAPEVSNPSSAIDKSTFGSFGDSSGSRDTEAQSWPARHPRITLAAAILAWVGSLAAAYLLGAAR